ncbi:MAG: hypothetical protein JW982_15685 [Spirochaetes bacterium]|nr:hypothetical protein [Spirochaetota bacterium]
MKKIFYSMAGEGRGHASRAFTVIENLKHKYDIHVYAPDHAFDLLHPVYRKTDVKIKKIPGLLFHYNREKKIDYLKTFTGSMKFFMNSAGALKHVYADFEKHNPDLVITDFESLLPKAAEKYDTPYISINHQHFLTYYNLSCLPSELRNKAAMISPLLNLFHMNQLSTIISSFYFPELKKVSGKNVHQVGVFLNNDILNAVPEDKGFILVYLRRFLSEPVLRSLETCGEKVRIYCSGNNEDYKNIEFKKISQKAFAEDLSKCSILVTTAGNQLVGEALYLGKKIIAIPEPNNFEQEINGFFLENSGGGRKMNHDSFNENTVSGFLRDRDSMNCSIPLHLLNGNNQVQNLIDYYINEYGSETERYDNNTDRRLIS